jgi:hypothetical protein
MIDRAKSGEPLDLGLGPLDPELMKAWGPDRTVRASLLRSLLVDEVWPVHAKGVQLQGVRISGRLDLEAATLRCPLRMDYCYFDAPQPTLDYATASVLAFTRCLLAGLTGDTVTVTQDLNLTGSIFTGPVLLGGANVAGGFICRGTKLEGANPVGNALGAENLKVGRDVFFRDGFTAAGAIWLVGADIAGDLECSGAKLNGTNTDGNALVADNLKVNGNVLLRNGFTAAGGITLLGANITGDLDCSDAKLNRANNKRQALVAERVTVGGEAFLRGKFSTADTAGAVSLLGANIAGNLDFDGAKLKGTNADGNALIGDTLSAGRNVFFRDVQGLLVVPDRARQQVLPPVWPAVPERLGDGPAVVIIQLHQQPADQLGTALPVSRRGKHPATRPSRSASSADRASSATVAAAAAAS